MKTIYNRIQTIESNINDIEKSIELLTKKGFEVNGDVPVLKEEIDKILSSPEYRDNSIVQRLRGGEDLTDIVNEIASERKYSLKFNKKKREKFNEKVDELDEIIPYAYNLKRYSIFHPISGPENLGTYLGGLAGFLSLAILHTVNLHVDQEISRNVIRNVSLGMGGFFGLIGGWVGYFTGSTSEALSTLKDKVKYIGKINKK